MDNRTEIQPWPEPVDGKELLNKMARHFDSFPKAVRTLAPLWLMASYFDESVSPLKAQHYTLKKMLATVATPDRQKFLLLLREIVHPRFRPLIDQRFAELPSKIREN
jgi:hypothetical protein